MGDSASLGSELMHCSDAPELSGWDNTFLCLNSEQNNRTAAIHTSTGTHKDIYAMGTKVIEEIR